MVKHLENEGLKDLIKEGVHVIDFFAEWCGPCKMLAPILETLDDIDIIKVNVDEHKQLAAEYGIMTIPTLVFVKDGEIMQQEVGFRTKEDIESIVNKIK